jgi:IS605 OrfB family transposase
VIGIDQGIRHLAVTSDGQFISSGELNRRTAQYRRNRGRLESKGTPSSRKRLKSLGCRENRFRDDYLHRAVKSILSECQDVKIIVIEDLKKIERKRGRTLNRRLSNWAIARFPEILTCKSEEIGILVEREDPRYTSQKCSQCGKVLKSNRDLKLHLYSCSCGNRLNDDLNAARNTRANYLRAIGEGDGAQSTAPDVTVTDAYDW